MKTTRDADGGEQGLPDPGAAPAPAEAEVDEGWERPVAVAKDGHDCSRWRDERSFSVFATVFLPLARDYPTISR